MKKKGFQSGKMPIKKPFESPEDYDNLYTVNAGSYTDCTGLMYKPPHNDFEYDSYTDMYHFQPSGFDADYYGDDE